MAIFNSYVCLPEGTKLELVGGLEYVLCFHILGMSSSQLTNSMIFQRSRLKPPTSVSQQMAEVFLNLFFMFFWSI